MIFQTEKGNSICLAHVVTVDKPKTAKNEADGVTEIFVGVQLNGVPKGSIFNKTVAHVKTQVPGATPAAPKVEVVDEEATAKKVAEVEKEAAVWYEKITKALNDFYKTK